MKKCAVLRLRTYGLLGLGIISTLMLGTSDTVLTQIPKPSIHQQKTIPASSLIWPAQGNISQGFRKYQHEGIDIAGASGTPIFAAAVGTIVKAGWDDWGLGKAITIKHPDGRLTVYGHNQRLLVSKGQQVTQGQMIAEMGSTGNSTGPHLHFEIHSPDRFAFDPFSLLPSAIAGKTPSPQVSPSQPIPVASLPQITDIQCLGNILIAGETLTALVKVCQENGQLFYLGQSKQVPNQPVKLRATSVGTTQYRAENGSFSYFVNPNGVEIWRNGIPLRSDIFYTSKR